MPLLPFARPSTWLKAHHGTDARGKGLQALRPICRQAVQLKQLGVGQCHAVERTGPGAAFRKAEASSASPIALADSVSTPGACSGAQRALVAAMPASPQDPTSTAVAVAGAGCPLSISLHRCCSHGGGWVGRWLPSHTSLEAELSVEAAQHTLQAGPRNGLGSRHGQQRITSGVIPRPRIAGCTRKSLPLLLSLLLPVLPLPSAATAALTCRAAGHALLPRQPATKITSAAIAAPASTGRMGRPLLAVGCRQGNWQHIQRCTCKHGRPGGWCTTVNAAAVAGDGSPLELERRCDAKLCLTADLTLPPKRAISLELKGPCGHFLASPPFRPRTL